MLLRLNYLLLTIILIRTWPNPCMLHYAATRPSFNKVAEFAARLPELEEAAQNTPVMALSPLLPSLAFSTLSTFLLLGGRETSARARILPPATVPHRLFTRVEELSHIRNCSVCTWDDLQLRLGWAHSSTPVNGQLCAVPPTFSQKRLLPRRRSRESARKKNGEETTVHQLLVLGWRRRRESDLPQ